MITNLGEITVEFYDAEVIDIPVGPGPRHAVPWELDIVTEDRSIIRVMPENKKTIAGRTVDQLKNSISRRVLVYRDDTGALAAETISNAADGVFMVQVDDYPATTYTIYMQPEGADQRNAPIYSRIVPN